MIRRFVISRRGQPPTAFCIIWTCTRSAPARQSGAGRYSARLRRWTGSGVRLLGPRCQLVVGCHVSSLRSQGHACISSISVRLAELRHRLRRYGDEVCPGNRMAIRHCNAIASIAKIRSSSQRQDIGCNKILASIISEGTASCAIPRTPIPRKGHPSWQPCVRRAHKWRARECRAAALYIPSAYPPCAPTWRLRPCRYDSAPEQSVSRHFLISAPAMPSARIRDPRSSDICADLRDCDSRRHVASAVPAETCLPASISARPIAATSVVRKRQPPDARLLVAELV